MALGNLPLPERKKGMVMVLDIFPLPEKGRGGHGSRHLPLLEKGMGDHVHRHPPSSNKRKGHHGHRHLPSSGRKYGVAMIKHPFPLLETREVWP